MQHLLRHAHHLAALGFPPEQRPPVAHPSGGPLTEEEAEDATACYRELCAMMGEGPLLSAFLVAVHGGDTAGVLMELPGGDALEVHMWMHAT